MVSSAAVNQDGVRQRRADDLDEIFESEPMPVLPGVERFDDDTPVSAYKNTVPVYERFRLELDELTCPPVQKWRFPMRPRVQDSLVVSKWLTMLGQLQHKTVPENIARIVQFFSTPWWPVAIRILRRERGVKYVNENHRLPEGIEGVLLRSIIIDASSMAPRNKGLFVTALHKTGAPQLTDIEVPTLTALLTGYVPVKFWKNKTLFGTAIGQIGLCWFGKNLAELAATFKMDQDALKRIISGKELPEYSVVRDIVANLGLDNGHELELMWYADLFKRMNSEWRLNKGMNPNERGRFLAGFAEMRLGRKIGDVSGICSLDRVIEVTKFFIEASVPAETAIAVVAELISSLELFRNMGPYLEHLKLKNGKSLQELAILSLVASKYCETHGDAVRMVHMAFLGSEHLLRSAEKSELCTVLNSENARRVGMHFLNRGLEIHSYLKRNGNKKCRFVDPEEFIVGEMTKLLGGGVLAQMPEEQREVAGEFAQSFPKTWDEIIYNGRTDLVDQAFAVADVDAHGMSLGPSHAIFNAALPLLHMQAMAFI